MTDARRIAKLEAQVAALRARLSARTDQLLLVLLQIDDLKKALGNRSLMERKAEAWDELAIELLGRGGPGSEEIIDWMGRQVPPL